MMVNNNYSYKMYDNSAPQMYRSRGKNTRRKLKYSLEDNDGVMSNHSNTETDFSYIKNQSQHLVLGEGGSCNNAIRMSNSEGILETVHECDRIVSISRPDYLGTNPGWWSTEPKL